MNDIKELKDLPEYNQFLSMINHMIFIKSLDKNIGEKMIIQVTNSLFKKRKE